MHMYVHIPIRIHTYIHRYTFTHNMYHELSLLGVYMNMYTLRYATLP